MVCPHHQFGARKLLAIPLLWEPYTNHRRAVRIEFRCAIRFSGFFYAFLNSDISSSVLYGHQG
jgi:hypothetical protein